MDNLVKFFNQSDQICHGYTDKHITKKVPGFIITVIIIWRFVFNFIYVLCMTLQFTIESILFIYPSIAEHEWWWNKLNYYSTWGNSKYKSTFMGCAIIVILYSKQFGCACVSFILDYVLFNHMKIKWFLQTWQINHSHVNVYQIFNTKHDTQIKQLENEVEGMVRYFIYTQGFHICANISLLMEFIWIRELIAIFNACTYGATILYLHTWVHS